MILPCLASGEVLRYDVPTAATGRLMFFPLYRENQLKIETIILATYTEILNYLQTFVL